MSRARLAPRLLAAGVVALVAWVWLLPPSRLKDPGVLEGASVLAPDGVRDVLNGDFDAYTWMRAAENVLAKGDPCDSREGGVCRDTKVLGPAGVRWLYAENLHVYAIAAFEKVARLFRPAFPLPRAAVGVAFVVVLLGALGAFAFGWRQAGAVGALAAAFLPVLQPTFMDRAANGDNDCWQITLPILSALALAESFRARQARDVALCAALAGIPIALCAWTWSGWVFFHTIWLLALGAVWLVELATDRQWKRGLIRLGVYLAVSSGGAVLVGGAGVLRLLHASEPARAATLPWPDSFSTVAELKPTSLSDVAASVGGWISLLLGAVGVAASASRAWGSERRSSRMGVPILVGGWLVAACVVGVRGVRFLQFPATPVALGWACLAGAVAEELTRRRAIIGLGFAVAALQIPVVQAGIDQARRHQLLMTRAWWDTFTTLRETSAKDAIIHTWWDYGYWAKFLTDRRVSTDGGTLGTHANHWVGRALLAPEAESIGILRMLGCGADALPLPEGEHGALALAIEAAHDDLGGYELLRAVLPLSRTDARSALARRQVDAAAADRLLAASHCDPPETWLVLSDRQMAVTQWIGLGGYDIAAARALELVRGEGAAAARASLRSRSGLSEAEADRVVGAASEAISKGEIDSFAQPHQMFVDPEPLPCKDEADGTLVCALASQGLEVEAPPFGPVRVRTPDHSGIPGLVVQVKDTGRSETTQDSATLSTAAAVIDWPGRRAWIMTSELARSTFVSLFLLGARDSPYFEKVFEKKAGPRGRPDTVATFRVRWPKER